MARDFYEDGYECGHASASVSEKAIRAVGLGPRLAVLCGDRIAAVRLSSDDFAVRNSESWARGFFDGFLDRAERMLKGD